MKFFREASLRSLARAGLIGVVCSFAAPSQAQQFTMIQAFGDSYVDTGNLFRIVGPSPVYPTGRFSGGSNYVDTLSGLLGVGQRNYAIGGAMTGGTNTVGPGLPGFAQQWQGFLASGQRLAANDLMVLNIGGNDARQYYQTGGTSSGVSAAASASAGQALAGVNALVGAGARTLVFTVGDVGALPEAALYGGAAATGSAYNRLYNLQMQSSLGALAANGVRVEYVDIGLLGAQIKANPALYGIANVGACPLSCIGDPSLQAQYLFYVDGVHLTSAGFAIMGKYIANRLAAPLTFAAQGDVAMHTTQIFTSALFGRLDLFNTQSSIERAALAYAPQQATKDGPIEAAIVAPAQRSPLTVTMQVTGGIGDRSASRKANGYDWDSVGGMINVDYRIAPEAMVGVAFNYSNQTVNQRNGAGNSDMDAYQIGVYGAWNGPHLFAQGVFSYGFLDYRNNRPGVVSTITANPSGSTWGVSIKGGYLVDAMENLKMGPIIGFSYAHAEVDAHSEYGDPVLTLAVRKQQRDAYVGSAGMQARAPFLLTGRKIEAYLNLTAENNFGSGALMQYGAVSAPLIVNNWDLKTGSNQLYGKVAVGATMEAWSNVAMTFTLAQTMGRKGGDAFMGSGGFKIGF